MRPEIKKDPNLETCLLILCGDETTLVELTNTWYELLVAKMIYQKPDISKAEARYIDIDKADTGAPLLKNA